MDEMGVDLKKKRLLKEYCLRGLAIAPDEPIWCDVYEIGLTDNGLCVLSLDKDYLDNYRSDVMEIPDIFDDISRKALKQISTHYNKIGQFYRFRMNGLKVLPRNAFKFDDFLLSINLERCKYISKDAFLDCSNLEFISVPHINTVFEYAFDGCNKLITFSGSPYHIKECAFSACFRLSSFNFERTLDIGAYSFTQCRSLRVCKANKCIKLEKGCFSYSGLEEFEANKLKTIEYEAFRNSKLKEFKADSLVTLENNVFENCYLTSFENASVKNVGENTFFNMNSLKSLSLPNVKYVLSEMISDCHALQDIRLDKCVYIDNHLFGLCKSLDSIYLPSIKDMKVLGYKTRLTLYINKEMKDKNNVLGYYSKVVRV